MGYKKTAVLASAAIVTGFLLLSCGTLLLVPAEVNPFTTSSNDVIEISAGENKVVDSGIHVGNMAPGDKGANSFIVKNVGSTTELVTLTTTPDDGYIFRDNGATGNSLNAVADPDENNTVHGISMDFSKYGDTFKFDNHPLQVSYKIVSSLHKDIWDGPFSNGVQVSQFSLGVGESAEVTYYYNLPIQAHNDYQGTEGNLNISLKAEGAYTPPPPAENNTPENNTTPPPPPPGNNTTNSTAPPPPNGGPGTGGGVPGGTKPVTGLPIISIVIEALLAVVVGGALVVLSRNKSNES